MSVFANIFANKTSQKIVITPTISFLTLLLTPVLYSYISTVVGVEQNLTDIITNTNLVPYSSIGVDYAHYNCIKIYACHNEGQP